MLTENIELGISGIIKQSLIFILRYLFLVGYFGEHTEILKGSCESSYYPVLNSIQHDIEGYPLI